MSNHYADRYDRSLRSAKSTIITHDSVEEYQEKSQKVHREKKDFLHREFDYKNYIFAPEGYEGIMLFFYIMTIPYLVALAFLFLFIARSSFELFLELNLTSYFIVWAIGYEICAVLALIIFFYSWFSDDSSDNTPSAGVKGNGRITPRFRN